MLAEPEDFGTLLEQALQKETIKLCEQVRQAVKEELIAFTCKKPAGQESFGEHIVAQSAHDIVADRRNQLTENIRNASDYNLPERQISSQSSQDLPAQASLANAQTQVLPNLRVPSPDADFGTKSWATSIMNHADEEELQWDEGHHAVGFLSGLVNDVRKFNSIKTQRLNIPSESPQAIVGHSTPLNAVVPVDAGSPGRAGAFATPVPGEDRAEQSEVSGTWHVGGSWQPPIRRGMTVFGVDSVSNQGLRFRRGLAVIVTSSTFDYCVGVLVLINAITIGAQVDWAARHPGEESPAAFKVVSWLFCGLFTVELAMRIVVFGGKFFYNQDWRWNVFDTVIVACQLAEELTSLLVDAIVGSELSAEYTNFTAVRVLRVLRLVRVMRFMRILRLIRELHTMVGSIITSARSFLWTIALLLLMMYVVGVYITQFVADHIRTDPQAFQNDPALERYYGSLGSSILSLFQALSGGVDWEDLLTPLQNSAGNWNVGMAIFYSSYIAFSTFVMLNLVTGIFVDSAQTNIREDRDLDLVNRVYELFMTADDDQSGKITWEEFDNCLSKPEMEEYFKVIDLDMSEAGHLFELLDVHGTGSISSHEFVNGCLRMRGPAKAYDVASHIRWSKRAIKKVHSSIKQVDLQMRLIGEKLDVGPRNFDHMTSNEVQLTAPKVRFVPDVDYVDSAA